MRCSPQTPTIWKASEEGASIAELSTRRVSPLFTCLLKLQVWRGTLQRGSRGQSPLA